GFRGEELSRDLLDRLREIPFQDPAEEPGLLAAHVLESPAAVLAEVDRGLAVDETEAPLRVDILVEPRAEKRVELRDGARQISVAHELARDHRERHFRVRERSVGSIVVRLAIEARGGGQVPGL